MLGINKARENFEKWWLGKYCRRSDCKELSYQLVVSIDVYGPPSFVYGSATLHFSDGSEMNLPYDPMAYRPTKKSIDAITPEQYAAQQIIGADRISSAVN